MSFGLILEFRCRLLYHARFHLEINSLLRLKPYFLLGIFALVLFLPGIFSIPALDRDEAHFAQASRQMVQTGNYFQIRFQNITRFQKPPGINWLQAASVNIFSHENLPVIWPYRLPSLLSALLAVFLTFFFARRFVESRVALLASAFLASTLLLIVEEHMAVTDTSLLSAVLLMQGALWVIFDAGINNKRPHWAWALLFWTAMAYGFVLKGVTPLVGILSTVTLCIMERQLKWLRGLHIFWGFLLFILLGLAWLIPVNTAESSNYLMQMFNKDLLPKLQGGHESHGKPPLFHVIILPLTFWPVSLFLWQAVVYAFNKRQQQVIRFLLAWIVPTWLFFEIMPTKLPQYVLPTFPAIALLCALAILDKDVAKPSRFLRVLQILWGILSLGLAIAVLLIPYLVLQEVTVGGILVFSVISLMSLACLYFAYFGRYQQASITVLLTALLSFPLIFGVLLPKLNPLWISRHVAEVIPKEAISEQRPLLAVGYSEPSLVFYLNTKQVLFIDNQKALNLRQQYPQSLLLINKNAYPQMVHDLGPFVTIATIKGYNYSSGRWIELILCKKGDKK